MLASADMQTVWAGGSTPKQMSPAEVQHLHPGCFPGASLGDQPSLGAKTALRWAFLGKHSEGQPAVAQVTGRKDSFYWAKLCLSRLPVLPGYATLELEGWMSKYIRGLQDNLGIR